MQAGALCTSVLFFFEALLWRFSTCGKEKDGAGAAHLFFFANKKQQEIALSTDAAGKCLSVLLCSTRHVHAKGAAAAHLIFFFGNRQDIARSTEAAEESLGVLLDTCALKAPQLLKDEVAC